MKEIKQLSTELNLLAEECRQRSKGLSDIGKLFLADELGKKGAHIIANNIASYDGKDLFRILIGLAEICQRQFQETGEVSYLAGVYVYTPMAFEAFVRTPIKDLLRNTKVQP